MHLVHLMVTWTRTFIQESLGLVGVPSARTESPCLGKGRRLDKNQTEARHLIPMEDGFLRPETRHTRGLTSLLLPSSTNPRKTHGPGTVREGYNPD